MHGHVQLHATHRRPSWTSLAKTASRYTTELHLMDAVEDWQPGDLIAIAATGKHFGQTENAIVRNISKDLRTITVEKELDYQHVGKFDSCHSIRIHTPIIML